jgi:hypothetical protein
MSSILLYASHVLLLCFFFVLGVLEAKLVLLSYTYYLWFVQI